jgi:hypothetical protein
MGGTTVRVSRKTHDALRELAEQTHQSMQDVLARAVEAYRRDHLLREINTAYAALRADPDAWREEQADRAIWEGTLTDGLEHR